ncbi:hypothetical protein FACS1894184_06050 [Clostridia bacterium]|nr:hypothetical protein FACS1894184_06050 [Clostridia bacterium]
MDQDSKITSAAYIETYRKCLTEYQVAVLGPQFVYDRRKKKAVKENEYKRWIMLSGALLNLDVFEKLGGFDERLFIDGIDVEYCLRVRKNGYRILQCCEAILFHKPAETRKLKIGSIILLYGWHNEKRYYYQAMSRAYIMITYHDYESFLKLIVKFLKILLLFDHKKTYFQHYFRGIHDGCRLISNK